MAIVLSMETRLRISTDKARRPSISLDPNVGKSASVKSGVYANLPGIVYPRNEGVRYVKTIDGVFHGDHTIEVKPYLLLLFYDDGSLFCGVSASASELSLDGAPPSGTGSLVDPYGCGSATGYLSGVLREYEVVTVYHSLPLIAGNIDLSFKTSTDIRAANYSVAAYYVNDPETIVASTGGYSRGSVHFTFYYDPRFNGEKVMFKIIADTFSGGINYKLTCPVTIRPDGTIERPYPTGTDYHFNIVDVGMMHFELPSKSGKVKIDLIAAPNTTATFKLSDSRDFALTFIDIPNVVGTTSVEFDYNHTMAGSELLRARYDVLGLTSAAKTLNFVIQNPA